MQNNPRPTNVNSAPRLSRAPLSSNFELLLADGLHCPCGRPVRNFPDQLAPHGFRLVCDGHHDVVVYQPRG